MCLFLYLFLRRNISPIFLYNKNVFSVGNTNTMNKFSKACLPQKPIFETFAFTRVLITDHRNAKASIQISPLLYKVIDTYICWLLLNKTFVGNCYVSPKWHTRKQNHMTNSPSFSIHLCFSRRQKPIVARSFWRDIFTTSGSNVDKV